MGEYVSIIDDRKVKLEEVDILTLINEVKKDFSKTLLDSNDFKISLILLAWHQVHFSRFYLKSILNNLISNAIQYRRDGVSSYIHFETFIENDKKVLVIKDNGIGINLNRHGENVFKLYKRFHRNISGKGIGLFLVKSQLEALDATITIESKENIGTTFKIYF
jgi:signal transduction histidine kinase